MSSDSFEDYEDFENPQDEFPMDEFLMDDLSEEIMQNFRYIN